MTKRILIIDDDLAISQIVKISLQAIAGWEVLIANSGSEGLTIASAAHPDAILLDLMMPKMDGITTFQKMQANPTTRSIPTIFLTAKINGSEQAQISGLAIAGVISKPFKASDLVNQIRTILNWSS